jgi:hypothetical protein
MISKQLLPDAARTRALSRRLAMAGDSIECGGQQSADGAWSNQSRDMRERDRVGKKKPRQGGD